jgi:type III secretory pathway component EscS
MTSTTERIHDAVESGARQLDVSSDLFDRVLLSIEDDRRLRSQRTRRIAVVACLVGALAGLVWATTDKQEGELIMDWWILELVSFVGLVALALWLGPFIRRFGKSYAADVFRANPRTGKSFIALMDVAYYLVFFAYILFTTRFEPDTGWGQTVTPAQMQATAVRFGGILLIVGLLHGLNVLTLPLIGRLLTMNRQLEDRVPGTPPPAGPSSTPSPG